MTLRLSRIAAPIRPRFGFALRVAIDSLLQYLLRSICIQLAGESAGGTLWLRDNFRQGFRLRSVVRGGRILTPKEMRRLSVRGLQLSANELPDSGKPACCPGHAMRQWLSHDLRAFISLPISRDGRLLGSFVIWLKPSDAAPTADQMRGAASLLELAHLALQALKKR
jgi:hypothetical protein